MREIGWNADDADLADDRACLPAGRDFLFNHIRSYKTCFPYMSLCFLCGFCIFLFSFIEIILLINLIG